MPKTGKRAVRRHNVTKRYNVCKFPVTLVGLTHWYKDVFEKLGWMVLMKAHREGHYKIMAYKKSLKMLVEKLNCKLNTTTEPDRKTDIQIMIDNVKVLIHHANKDF